MVWRWTTSPVGRKARLRAEKHEAARHHGVLPPDQPEPGVPSRCPRCGSTNLAVTPYMSGVINGVDVICGNCNWQGTLKAGVWG